MEDTLLVSTEAAVTTVTVNKPQVGDTSDPDLIEQLTGLLQRIDADPASRVIVIRGVGDAFSSRRDTGLLDEVPVSRVHQPSWHLFHAFLALEKPTIAMIDGPAMGFGLSITLLCDCAIVSDSSILGDRHIRFGLAAGGGAAVLFPLLVGPSRAKELLMTGRTLDGRAAAELGLVTRSVPSDLLHTTVYDFAGKLAEAPPYALRATKLIVNRYVRWMADQSLEVALAYEEISTRLPAHHAANDPSTDRRRP